MSISMTDIQIMVQKAPDVAKPVLAESHHLSATQQNMAEKYTKESRLNEKRVLMTKRSESEMIDENGHRGSETRDNKKRNKDNRRKDETDQKTDTVSENIFDISI